MDERRLAYRSAMEWILIIVFALREGVSVTNVGRFESEAACKAASERLKDDLTDNLYGARMNSSCVPTALTSQPSAR